MGVKNVVMLSDGEKAKCFRINRRFFGILNEECASSVEVMFVLKLFTEGVRKELLRRGISDGVIRVDKVG